MDIGKVRVAALADYEGLTEDQKEAARTFFEAMDTDKSGDISIDEFMAFLSHAGLQSDNHDRLFEELDKNDNGTLDFNELITFFYIISRDEYKDLLNSRPSTDAPPRKKRFGNRNGEAKSGSTNWGEFFQRLNRKQDMKKIAQSMGQVGETLIQSGCSIL